MKVDEVGTAEAPGSGHAGPRASGMSREPVSAVPLDVRAVRGHFVFPGAGRVVTNNAASTQPPGELLELYRSLGPGYENVHRGQSGASRAMTWMFEEAYGTIARLVGAPGPECIALYRNTTEAVNAVMYALLTEFGDGDNVVTTLLEHNSNYVPWHGLCREILPRLGRRVQCRLARFDPVTGELDLDHLASLIDARTKLVAVTGASNFLGTRPDLAAVRALADGSGYAQPGGERRSYLLVDGAQLVPGSYVDVQALDVDFLAFSFHKLLAPFGVGVLYAKAQLLAASLPFLYGGDMIAEGQVFPGRVGYNALPWKYAAGTPNILGAIISAQAVRLLVDLALSPRRPVYFGTSRPVDRPAVHQAMGRISAWNRQLTTRALAGLATVPGITIYGPTEAARRTSLVAFNLAGHDPMAVAGQLDRAGIEARAGCHCATLAHHSLGLDPPASCRLSFYLYNTPAEIDQAIAAVTAIATGHPPTLPWYRRLRRPARPPVVAASA
ncbi:MAG TPA: aminotransferase class V-fold PLP-dependent enzyme [Streptosporangiaceae bacterium]|nr:aminotransferase class V-fold PLP-dependent enzyme [Streptosporangiaceae bacterium]